MFWAEHKLTVQERRSGNVCMIYVYYLEKSTGGHIEWIEVTGHPDKPDISTVIHSTGCEENKVPKGQHGDGKYNREFLGVTLPVKAKHVISKANLKSAENKGEPWGTFTREFFKYARFKRLLKVWNGDLKQKDGILDQACFDTRPDTRLLNWKGAWKGHLWRHRWWYTKEHSEQIANSPGNYSLPKDEKLPQDTGANDRHRLVLKHHRGRADRMHRTGGWRGVADDMYYDPKGNVREPFKDEVDDDEDSGTDTGSDEEDQQERDRRKRRARPRRHSGRGHGHGHGHRRHRRREWSAGHRYA